MKKLLFASFLLTLCYFNSYAQNKDSINVNKNEKNITLSAEGSAYVGNSYGITFESVQKKNKYLPKTTQSSVIKVYYITSTLESDNPFLRNIDGNGFGLEFGSRTYLNEKTNKGIFIGGHIGSGSITYENNDAVLGSSEPVKFDGTYRYLTFFAPEVGYKFLIAQKVAVSLHVGTAWLIEVKGKGDVDNKNFDNWVGRAGLSIGYKF
jgi:hypothetical protein